MKERMIRYYTWNHKNGTKSMNIWCKIGWGIDGAVTGASGRNSALGTFVPMAMSDT